MRSVFLTHLLETTAHVAVRRIDKGEADTQALDLGSTKVFINQAETAGREQSHMPKRGFVCYLIYMLLVQEPEFALFKLPQRHFTWRFTVSGWPMFTFGGRVDSTCAENTTARGVKEPKQIDAMMQTVQHHTFDEDHASGTRRKHLQRQDSCVQSEPVEKAAAIATHSLMFHNDVTTPHHCPS